MVRDTASAHTRAIGSEWLSELVDATVAGGELSEAMRGFVAAPRHVGRDDVTIAGNAWPADVAARVGLLCAIAAGAGDRLFDTVDALFREGDNREKTAIVRALCLLPDSARFIDIALETGRTNDTTLFAAVACDNPYPAQHYPELEYNKLVMKSAFVGAPIDRILGLSDRANPELSRMAMEYIDEQEHARRRFPPELFAAIGAHPRPGSIARMLGYLSHSIVENRLWAARGLALANDERTRGFLRERLDIETDAAVAEAISAALSQ